MPDPITRLNEALQGRYTVERELGEGGMATVYLAEDLKHHRKVALKVLKPELAAVVGAERFLAEIETTANLQHPHILPLFDSGEAGSFLFYVMPYVEGETLRQKLDRERQLPVDEARRIATDMAEAVDYAHRQGIIHRDLKPANVLMHEGRPLIADFGIALAIGAAGGTRLTETGLSVGTPFYMSPEQATGDQVVGAASDTYALACVLYEMLIGEPPYVGATAQAVLGKIISGGPVSATEQRPSIPANVDAAIRKALEKLPADRFPSAKELVAALADPAFRHGPTVTAGAPVGPWNRLSLATTVLAVLFAVGFGWAVTRPDPVVRTTRLSVALPAEESTGAAMRFDVARDGSFMVYEGPGAVAGSSRLWLRSFDALEATPIRDSETGFYPAISPNGEEVAFFRAGAIRVVPLQGGVTRTLVESDAAGVIRWSWDGSAVIYQPTASNDVASQLFRVPAAGGPSEFLIETDSDLDANMWFDPLPTGQHLVVEMTYGGDPAIHVVDLESGEWESLAAGQFPRYSEGQVLFVSPDGTTLLAAPVDSRTGLFTTPATPVTDQLLAPAGAWNYFAASHTGTLLYASGTPPEVAHELVWVTREGAISSIDPDWTFDPGGNNRGFSLSPDGRQVAATTREEGNYDIWIKELPRGPRSRLTSDPAQDVRPRWTPDGESVTFLSDRNATLNVPSVYSKRASGLGEAERVMTHDRPLWEAAYSPDMEFMLARTGGTTTVPGGRDVWSMRTGTDEEATALIVTPFDEKAIAISPDGRWLLYEADQTGVNEVYVQPFPNVDDGRWTVSIGGGVMPRWAHGGQEIFYINPAGEMVAASVVVDPTFRVADRSTLFALPEGILFRQGEQYPLYEVGLEDDRFMMLRAVGEDQGETELIFVQNWMEGRDGG